MNIWEPVVIEKDRYYYWQINPLKLWIKRTKDEWLIASEQSSEEIDNEKVMIAEFQEKPETLAWNRFVCADDSNIIQLLPALQDRAVVVGSEMPVKIFPDNSALFFLSIPIWIRIYAGENRKIMLTEIATIVLSNTWFGDPTTGELCYSLRTRARRSIDDLEISPHRAVCPVQIINRSQINLDFQKLSVHVEHLKIYSGQKRLWTNEVCISFVSEDQLSKIVFSDKIPAFEDGCTLLSEERAVVDKSILKRSISILKYFTTFE